MPPGDIGNEEVVVDLVLVDVVLCFASRQNHRIDSEIDDNSRSIFLSSWCNLSLSSVCNSSTLNALRSSLHAHRKITQHQIAWICTVWVFCVFWITTAETRPYRVACHRDESTMYSHKTEIVYTGRQRTTSFNENATRVNKKCKHYTYNKSGNFNRKRLSLFVPP